MINRRVTLTNSLMLGAMALAACVAAGGLPASASEVHANKRQIFGFYQVIETTDGGPDVEVVLQLELFNHGGNDLQIEHAALATPHPVQGNSRSLIGIRIDAHHSQTITEQFTVPRREYERWQKISPPKLVLDTRTSLGERHIKTVLLDNRRGQEGN